MADLLRARLITLADHDHRLLIVVHHIVADGWSLDVLKQELGTLYAAFRDGRESPLAPLTVQYADFAQWQRETLTAACRDRLIAYWRRTLADAPPSLELPLDRQRPADPRQTGARLRFHVPPSLADALRAAARREKTTSFVVAFTTFTILLHRYTHQDDIVVGVPTAGRNRAELAPLIGFFANTLALRTRLAGNPRARDVVAQVHETTRDAEAHQELPFEQLVDALHPPRDLARNPLFQVMFAHVKPSSAQPAASGPTSRWTSPRRSRSSI